jgi:magnesium chelatase subunit I
VQLTPAAVSLCAVIAAEFKIAGHRGEIVMAQAARATAALAGRIATVTDDVRKVAQYAIMHRRSAVVYGEPMEWTEKDTELLEAVCLEG